MPAPNSNHEKEALAAVKAIYSELASRPVERQCVQRTECCQFKLTGQIPYLTRGEALVALKALRASGRKQLPTPNDGACPMLQTHSGRCIIYADRPFGCRTHFCKAAGGDYDRKDIIDLIRKLETIDAQLGGDGPRSLPAALEAVI